MENIKAAVLAVCAVSAVRCVVTQLLTSSRLKNHVVLILDLLLALTMVTPFAQGTASFELPGSGDQLSAEYDMSRDKYAEAMAAATASNISDILEEQITAAGIGCEKIYVDVNISAEYSISISSVTVIADDFEAAALIIKSSLGNETEVVNGSY